MKLGVIKIPNTQIDILSAQITNFNAFGTSAPYLATNDLDLDTIKYKSYTYLPFSN